MLALVIPRVLGMMRPVRVARTSDTFRGFRVRFAASSSSDATSVPPGRPNTDTDTIDTPTPVSTVNNASAHKGPTVKRTAGKVAPRRTAESRRTDWNGVPDDESGPSTPRGNGLDRKSYVGSDAGPEHIEVHRKQRVKRFVKRAPHSQTSKGSVFPYTHDDFDFDGVHATAADIEKAFAPLVSAERQARLESVIDQRTFDLMPVLEGVYDIGNVLAVCRSAEALGVGCLGVISDEGLVFKQSGRTSGGAVKWTHLDQWRSTTNAVADLKNRGYRVLVTVFEGDAKPLEEYDWSIPTAVILGNEREGVSDEAKALADGGVYISMSGFTESLNVSVASSLTMHHAVQDRRKRSGPKNCSGNLSDAEKKTLRALYLAKLVPNYSRQGYLRQLLERSGQGQGASLKDIDDLYDQLDSPQSADPEKTANEIEDEVSLLNALSVAKIVKRPRKKKWGRPVSAVNARILQEVRLAPTRALTEDYKKAYPKWDKTE